MRVEGLRFTVSDRGFQVSGFEFRVYGHDSREFQVWSGFRVSSFGFRVSGSGLRFSGFGLGRMDLARARGRVCPGRRTNSASASSRTPAPCVGHTRHVLNTCCAYSSRPVHTRQVCPTQDGRTSSSSAPSRTSSSSLLISGLEFSDAKVYVAYASTKVEV